MFFFLNVYQKVTTQYSAWVSFSGQLGLDSGFGTNTSDFGRLVTLSYRYNVRVVASRRFNQFHLNESRGFLSTSGASLCGHRGRCNPHWSPPQYLSRWVPSNPGQRLRWPPYCPNITVDHTHMTHTHTHTHTHARTDTHTHTRTVMSV